MVGNSMIVICLANAKGGTSKSTLAINVACEAQRCGETVKILEIDPQGSVSAWAAERLYAPPLVESVNGADIGPKVQAARDDGFTVTVIDTAGTHSPSDVWAARESDLVLIPSRPSGGDMQATVKTVQTVAQSRKRPAFVFSFVGSTASNGVRAADEMRKRMDDPSAVLICPTNITHHDAYALCLPNGKSVRQLQKTGKQVDEIRDLWKWIKQTIEAGNA